jgi:hypothetical protein
LAGLGGLYSLFFSSTFLIISTVLRKNGREFRPEDKEKKENPQVTEPG